MYAGTSTDLGTETIEGTAGALEGVNNIESSDSLAVEQS